uniref:Uncharacterized protein n=1 Tax=viral metagenome TaxID=1070528 RepID=A0A6H1ZWJ2_9ZZZZ
MGWLKDGLEGNAGINRFGKNPAQYQFISWGNKRDEKGMGKLWIKNIRDNLKYWDTHQEGVLCKLGDIPSHEDDACIFVGASPILKKSVSHLKGINPRFKIIATNSSIKYLVDHGVIPDYCILLDGNAGKWTPEMAGLGKRCKDVVGLFAVGAHPESVRNWKGRFIVIPYHYGNKKLNAEISLKYGDTCPASGGSALTCAIALFAQFTKATIFLLAGNELSFKKHYYVQGEAVSDDRPCYFATDVFGKQVKTLSPLFEYKIWLENFIQCLAGSHYFCNCSEGILGVESDGTFMPWLDQKALHLAIKDIADAWAIEEMPSKEKAKFIYSELYKYDDYVPTLGANIWRSQFDAKNSCILRKDEIKTILDFGCGTGDGVMVLREKGLEAYGVDIAENKELWDRKGVGEFCRSYDGTTLPYADDSFDMVGCFETFEHIIPEDCENLLKELLRVGKNFFTFTIALNLENAPFQGILYTHCNVQSPEWWVELIERVGFNVLAKQKILYNHEGTEDKYTLFIYATKRETDLRVWYDPISKLHPTEVAYV